MGNQIANIAGSIVVVAMITAVVSRKNSAAVIRSFGNAFSGAIRASLGK